MTLDEATHILGADVCARIAALVDEAPPLTEEQVQYLIALTTPDEDTHTGREVA